MDASGVCSYAVTLGQDGDGGFLIKIKALLLMETYGCGLSTRLEHVAGNRDVFR